ncbi:hypothetical protein HOLleu_00646 [Holothuria leucospilota]|uniref:DUF5641 domain-containing protein n=1 Tax=Holothuria leucospilota TaxID=206669 RepID=A0A9Q1CPY1_HOLLE|nr:hypothetical protein HOLleu_00646 [Holothuria leucospilota]
MCRFDALKKPTWKWVLNPPMAAHFGGIHESMIKSAKRAIHAILKMENADVNDEELLSAIVGAEGLINSKPITYQSANSKDDIPLTPNHFLHGQMGGRFAAEMAIDNTDFNPRKRWRRIQELVKHFWRRWLQEYPTNTKSASKESADSGSECVDKVTPESSEVLDVTSDDTSSSNTTYETHSGPTTGWITNFSVPAQPPSIETKLKLGGDALNEAERSLFLESIYTEITRKYRE